MSRRNQATVDQEVSFGIDEELVSTTDLRGVITYANDSFCKVSGYTINELKGKNHNMVRHPDMPPAAFGDMWSNLKSDTAWRGAVKNRCKDGRYYWVDAFVTPIYENGKKVGYQSVRQQLLPEYKHRAEKLYQRLNNGQSITPLSEKLAAFKLPLFIGCAALIAWLTSYMFWLWLLFVPLPFVIFYEELIRSQSTIKKTKAGPDSVSRHIYSGSDSLSYSDFQIKLLEGKVTTIVGRIIDGTLSLSKGADSLKVCAESAQAGVEKEASELHQVSSAVEEMVH